MLFTCSPTLHCWTVSNIPSSQITFPFQSIWGSFDYLFPWLPSRKYSEKIFRTYRLYGISEKHKITKKIKYLDWSTLDILDSPKGVLRTVLSQPYWKFLTEDLYYDVILDPNTLFTCFVNGSWKDDEVTCRVG